ncbi:MAG: class F sortase [Actinomycetota bacterium]
MLAALVAILASGGWDAGVPSAGGTSPIDPVERPPPASAAVLAPVPGGPSQSAPPAEVSRSPAAPPPVREVPEPTRVVIDGSGIDAEVVPVGVAEDGQMELPSHPDVVGWYRHGPAPGGGTGSAVLAGHVDSIEHGIGQLARLRETEVSDDVIVRTADGSKARYVVASVVRTPKAELPVADIFRRDGAERLVLITCGGEFDASRRSYEDNIIVTAVPR